MKISQYTPNYLKMRKIIHNFSTHNKMYQGRTNSKKEENINR